jgi:hypothetical protein
MVPGAGVAQSRKIRSFEEPFTRAKQDRRNRDVHLVDQAFAKVLLDDTDAATNANILAFGRVARLRQGGVNAFSNEVEGSASFHDQRRTRVVGQHEHWGVIDRILAPPTPPAVICPGSANRPEHVPAENPSSDIPKASSGKVIIDTCFSTIVAEQVLLERSGGEGPAMKRSAAHAEWVIHILPWASAETVE